MSEAFVYVNLGTPKSPEVSDVRSYLKEFLMDPYVIDIPVPLRALLVYGIIAPFRSPKSAHAYKQIWQPEGSPLMIHSKAVVQKLKTKLDTPVYLAMRYGQPSIQNVFTELKAKGYKTIYVFPAYPQYALSSTESVRAKVREVVKNLRFDQNQTALRFIESYADNEDFAQATADKIKSEADSFKPDYLLFSYHGLPIRHVKKISPNCQGEGACSLTATAWNQRCYRRQSYVTTDTIMKYLGNEFADKTSGNHWSVGFQSRLTEGWLKPYSDEFYKTLPQKGIRRLLVVCPSFTADCLETLEEVAMRGREDFIAAGGEDLKLVPCLNSDDAWVEAVAKIKNNKDFWSAL